MNFHHLSLDMLHHICDFEGTSTCSHVCSAMWKWLQHRHVRYFIAHKHNIHQVIHKLVHCAAWRPVFLQAWVRTWGPWADLTQQWLTTASPYDMNHISRLRVPQSLVDSVPSPQTRDLRYRVAWHQYHMIHATTLLRQSLTMPPNAPGTRKIATASTPIWYMLLRRKAILQHPKDDTLRTQVNYKPKRRDKHAQGPKHECWNPATKAHKLFQGPVTIDTASALL